MLCRGRAARRCRGGLVAALRETCRPAHRLGAAARRPRAARAARGARRRLEVGASGVTLSGYADRIDLLPAGMADILDYKTGSSPSKGQAHTLLAPQLALEGALLRRGAFAELGHAEPADLAYVRLKPNGEVDPGIDPRAQPATSAAPRPLRGGLGAAGEAARSTTRIRRPAICRAPCRFAKARPTATTTIWRACSNGRPAATVRAEGGDE